MFAVRECDLPICEESEMGFASQTTFFVYFPPVLSPEPFLPHSHRFVSLVSINIYHQLSGFYIIVIMHYNFFALVFPI
jgi:hypothetical protein